MSAPKDNSSKAQETTDNKKQNFGYGYGLLPSKRSSPSLLHPKLAEKNISELTSKDFVKLFSMKNLKRLAWCFPSCLIAAKEAIICKIFLMNSCYNEIYTLSLGRMAFFILCILFLSLTMQTSMPSRQEGLKERSAINAFCYVFPIVGFILFTWCIRLKENVYEYARNYVYYSLLLHVLSAIALLVIIDA